MRVMTSFLGHYASVGSKDPEMSRTVGHFVIFKEKAEVTQKCCICGSGENIVTFWLNLITG